MGCNINERNNWFGKLNGKEYINIIKKGLLSRSHNLYEDDYIFVQDNAPCHKSKDVMPLLKSENIRIMPYISTSITGS